MPFILKALSASGGRNNFLARDEHDFHRHLHDADGRTHLLAQQFIPNDTTHRLLVLGNDVALVIQRTWAPGTHLTNSQQGGLCTLVDPEDLDPHARALAVSAADLVGSQVAGVNIIQHWTSGCWYILDVNTNPAIATGAFVEHKIAAYRSYVHQQLRCPPGERPHGRHARPGPNPMSRSRDGGRSGEAGLQCGNGTKPEKAG